MQIITFSIISFIISSHHLVDKFTMEGDLMIESPPRESGVRPLLHCFAVEVIKEGDPEVVKGIITESKSGRQGGNSIAEKSIFRPILMLSADTVHS